MDDREFVNLRDFIYLDVERVKSLLAQLDRGLLSERSDSIGSSKSVEGKAGVSLPALLEVGGAGQYVTTDQMTETRTLHDFVYTQTEERLLELDRLKVLPDDFTSTRLLNQEVRASLSPVEYVLVRGRVAFSDYRYMTTMLDNLNDISRILTSFSYQERFQGASGKDKEMINREMTREISNNKLDDNYVKNLKKLFDLFLKDRLILRVVPFLDDPNIRVVGPLQLSLLRESLEDIRYKFGSSPTTDWTVFGQIASVPQEHNAREALNLTFSNDLDRALEGVFESLRGVEDQFRVTYPEIAITPIAIYRD